MQGSGPGASVLLRGVRPVTGESGKAEKRESKLSIVRPVLKCGRYVARDDVATYRMRNEECGARWEDAMWGN